MNSREKTTILEGEAVTYIPLSELHPFPNHPFKVRDDDAMSEMTESIMEYGILTPAIVRPAMRAAMRSWRATGANTPVNWQGWILFQLLSESWTAIWLLF